MKLKKFCLKTRHLILFFLMVFLGYFHYSFAQEALTLERSLEIAMKNSPNIKHLEFSIEQNRQLLNARNASLKSQFSFTLIPYSYRNVREFRDDLGWNTSKTKQSFGIFTIEQPIKWTDGILKLENDFSWRDSYSEFKEKIGEEPYEKKFSNSLDLSFTQPLFTYNTTKLELSELELNFENAALNYAVQRLSLEYQVTRNFFNVYQKKMSLEIAKDDLNNREQSYQIIKNKVEAGLDPQEELYQAELDLTKSKSQVQNEQVELDNFLDTFKQLIGLNIFDDVTVTADISHSPVEIDIQKALDTGLKYRMEIRQSQIEIERAQYELIRRSAMNEFRGDISLSYGMIGENEKVNQIYDISNTNQQLLLSLNIPLWDWGEKKARIKAYEANVTNNELSLEDEKKNIIIEIRQAYRNLRNLVNQIEIAEQNVRNAQLTYDINLERYKNGDLTSMDLNLIQNQLSQAKLDKISALINYKTELLNMKVLSLWDFQKNQRVVPEGIE